MSSPGPRTATEYANGYPDANDPTRGMFVVIVNSDPYRDISPDAVVGPFDRYDDAHRYADTFDGYTAILPVLTPEQRSRLEPEYRRLERDLGLPLYALG